MKHVFLISFVLWLSIDSLLAQKEQISGSRIAFRKAFNPGQPQPLVVLDGLVYDSLRLATDGPLAISKNPIMYINPDDIEAFTILKNDTAVYLYGDKAKYGVIVITTKKAKDKTDKIQKE